MQQDIAVILASKSSMHGRFQRAQSSPCTTNVVVINA